MFLFRFMRKCGLSSSRAYCIFTQPANSNGFVQLPIHEFNNRTFCSFLLVDLREIQYARDDERPHFCIHLNNIDNEVYCDFIVMLTSFQTISSINYDVTSQRLFINPVFHRHVRIVFLPNPPIAISNLPYCSGRG